MQHFGFMDPNPDLHKYPDPRIRFQGAKYQPKPKMLLSKHKLKFLTNNKLTKIFKFLNGSLSFSKKISGKRKKCFKNPDPFFSRVDPGPGSASE